MLRREYLLARKVLLLENHGRIGAGQVSLRLLQGCLIDRRVDLRDELPLLDRRVEIHVECLNLAGDLAADIDADQRAQGPAGRYMLLQGTAGDLGGFIARQLAARRTGCDQAQGQPE